MSLAETCVVGKPHVSVVSHWALRTVSLASPVSPLSVTGLCVLCRWQAPCLRCQSLAARTVSLASHMSPLSVTGLCVLCRWQATCLRGQSLSLASHMCQSLSVPLHKPHVSVVSHWLCVLCRCQVPCLRCQSLAARTVSLASPVSPLSVTEKAPASPYSGVTLTTHLAR